MKQLLFACHFLLLTSPSSILWYHLVTLVSFPSVGSRPRDSTQLQAAPRPEDPLLLFAYPCCPFKGC